MSINVSPGLDLEDPRFDRVVNYWRSKFRGRIEINESDLDDLAQEIRIALWLRGGPGPSQVAKFATLDWYRKFQRRRIREVVFEEIIAESRESSPERVMWLLKLEKLLDKLPERDRKLLYLKYMEDLSCKEIGEELKLSIARVGILLGLAEGKIRLLGLGRELVKIEPQSYDIRKRKVGTTKKTELTGLN